MPIFLLALLATSAPLQARRESICDPRASGVAGRSAARANGAVAPASAGGDTGPPGSIGETGPPDAIGDAGPARAIEGAAPVSAVSASAGPDDSAPDGHDREPAPGEAPRGDPQADDGADPEPEGEPDEAAGARSAEDPEGAARPPRFARASVEATAGRQDERRIEFIARAAAEGVTLLAGVESRSSQSAPERRAAILGAEFAAGGVWWEAELRASPESRGLHRLAARLGARGEAAGAALLVRDEALGQARLRAAGLAVDLETPLGDGAALTFAGSAWATSLSTRSRLRDPWSEFGAATLDWAEKWELSAGARGNFGRLLAAPAIAISQPAQDGALAARAGLSLELALGAARVQAAASVARLWPAGLWLGEATLGLAWHVGDE